METFNNPGFLPSFFDGYKLSYTYIVEDELKPMDRQFTCFGADEDSEGGYFCIGVYGANAVEGKYLFHGAGYWNFE